MTARTESLNAAAKRAGYVRLPSLFVTEAEREHIWNIARRHEPAITELRAKLGEQREWNE